MRRYIWIILFFLVLAAPFVMRSMLLRGEATSSGHVAGKLRIVTPHNQDIRREFERAFNQWHETTYGGIVEIEYLMPGGTNDIKRLLESTYHRQRDGDGQLPENVRADIDIVWGGGDFFFEVELNNDLGVLQAMDIDPQLLAAAFPSETLAGVKLREVRRGDDGRLLAPRWVGVCLSSFGIVYNPDVYAALGIAEPQSWADLTRPQLANLVALADPTRSGSAAVSYMMVLQRAMADAEAEVLAVHSDLAAMPEKQRAGDPRYQAAIARGWHDGMRQLLLIAANARYFTDSANLVPKDVSTGDAAAGMAIDFYGRTYQEVVGPQRVKFVSPRAATAITPDPVGILRGVRGEQKVLAERFIAFLLMREGQLLWITRPGMPGGPLERGLRRPPVRPDVYADRSGWSDDVNPFDEAGGFNQRGAWMALFTDTRPIWAAAWIDSREALKQAYATILRVPDATVRDRLIAELSNLPIEMKDVQALNATRRAKQQGNEDVSLWMTQERMKWAQRFRDHYRAVAGEAR